MININDFVWVTLTFEGYRLIAEKEWEGFYTTVTTHGFTRFQLWELMNVFGPYISASAPTYFKHGMIATKEPTAPLSDDR